MRLHIPSTRRTLVALVVIVAACGDMTAPAPTVVGDWRLQTAHVTVAGGSGTGVIVTFYDFRGDGTFGEGFVANGGNTAIATAGTYVVNGYSVILTYSDGTKNTASWNWSTLTFVRNGFTEIYEPDPPCAGLPCPLTARLGNPLPAPSGL